MTNRMGKSEIVPMAVGVALMIFFLGMVGLVLLQPVTPPLPPPTVTTCLMLPDNPQQNAYCATRRAVHTRTPTPSPTPTPPWWQFWGH